MNTSLSVSIEYVIYVVRITCGNTFHYIIIYYIILYKINYIII